MTEILSTAIHNLPSRSTDLVSQIVENPQILLLGDEGGMVTEAVGPSADVAVEAGEVAGVSSVVLAQGGVFRPESVSLNELGGSPNHGRQNRAEGVLSLTITDIPLSRGETVDQIMAIIGRGDGWVKWVQPRHRQAFLRVYNLQVGKAEKIKDWSLRLRAKVVLQSGRQPGRRNKRRIKT